MQDARPNKAKSTAIVFTNEKDTILRLMLASQSLEFAQTSAGIDRVYLSTHAPRNGS